MGRADFDAFVERKQEEEKEAGSFDPQKQLAEWRKYLDDLYSALETYVEPYTTRQTAEVTFDQVELNEEFSGPYNVRRMILRIGSSVIAFNPIGTMLIGFKGRVDVEGPRGSARLGLVNKTVKQARQLIHITVTLPGETAKRPNVPPSKIEWAWKIVTPAPAMDFIELTDESFFDMVLSVADA